MNLFLLIVIIWLISEIAWTIAWFWSSSIFLPLISNILDFKTALLLVAIYHIFWNLTRLSLFYKHINKKIFFLFWIPSIFFTIFWAMLSDRINQDILKIILWSILFSFALYSLINPNIKIRVNNIFWLIWWALSWFTAWLVWTGWVLRGAFLILFNLPKEQYIATIAAVALVVDFTRIPIYLKNGFLEQKYFMLIPVLFVTAFVGSFVWKKLVLLIPDILLKKIILITIMILSFFLIYNWFINIK